MLDTERKEFHILRALENTGQPSGARVIARYLQTIGIELNEHTVRYHLKMMDERGLTRLVGRRDGRKMTARGLAELNQALVNQRVSLALSKMESLAFAASFDMETLCGTLPVNLSFFPKNKFKAAMGIMNTVFRAGFCVSDLVLTAKAGETIGDVTVPEGMTCLATVCSVAVNGTLLKVGVPVSSRFGGLLQIRQHRPLRFSELIHYSGSSLDPSEIFIRAGMTSLKTVIAEGNGNILANFRELPSVCHSLALEVTGKLKEAGITGVLLLGNIGESVCEVPVDVGRVGVILLGGLNPVAAVQEVGIETENHAMHTLVEYSRLMKFEDVYQQTVANKTKRRTT